MCIDLCVGSASGLPILYTTPVAGLIAGPCIGFVLALYQLCSRAVVPGLYRAVVPGLYRAMVPGLYRAMVPGLYRAVVPGLYRAVVPTVYPLLDPSFIGPCVPAVNPEPPDPPSPIFSVCPVAALSQRLI